MPLTVAIDVLPRLRIDKGELVGHGPDNGPVFEMQLVHIKGPSSAEETPDAVDLRRSVRHLDGREVDLQGPCGQTTGLDTWPTGGSTGCIGID